MIFYALFDLYPVLLALAGDELYTGIAHAGHLGGLAFGLAYWKFDWNLEKSFSRLPTFRLRGPKLRVVGNRPPRRCDDDVLEAQLDEVLRKLHESGEESLTDLERIVLERASERYKRRGIGPNS